MTTNADALAHVMRKRDAEIESLRKAIDDLLEVIDKLQRATPRGLAGLYAVRVDGETCPNCRGSGRVRVMEDADGGERTAPAMWVPDDTETCPACLGFGVYPMDGLVE